MKSLSHLHPTLTCTAIHIPILTLIQYSSPFPSHPITSHPYPHPTPIQYSSQFPSHPIPIPSPSKIRPHSHPTPPPPHSPFPLHSPIQSHPYPHPRSHFPIPSHPIPGTAHPWLHLLQAPKGHDKGMGDGAAHGNSVEFSRQDVAGAVEACEEGRGGHAGDGRAAVAPGAAGRDSPPM